MTRKYLAFDIEIAKQLPEGEHDLMAYRPLGITCAATFVLDQDEPVRWYGWTPYPASHPSPQMNQQDVQDLVQYLQEWVAGGYTILTWNGLGFDFDILAEESGMVEECRELAIHHVDMMFHIFCTLGYPVSLQKVSEGMELQGKLEGIKGASAPTMWADGQYQQVLDYVAQDVRATLEVAQACEERGLVYWVTRRGSRKVMDLEGGWFTVEEALKLEEPDTSWMDSPMARSKFTAWLNKETKV